MAQRGVLLASFILIFSIPLDQYGISIISITDISIILLGLSLLHSYSLEQISFRPLDTAIIMSIWILGIFRTAPIFGAYIRAEEISVMHVKWVISGVLIIILVSGLLSAASTKAEKHMLFKCLTLSSTLIGFLVIINGYGIFKFPDIITSGALERRIIEDYLFVENRISVVFHIYASAGSWFIAGAIYSIASYQFRWMNRIFSIISFVVNFMAIIILQSRAVWLGLSVSIICYSFVCLYRDYHRWRKTGKFILVGSALIIGAILPPIVNFVISMQESTLSIRIQQIIAGYNSFLERPLLGVPFGTVFRQVGYNLHNTHAEMTFYVGSFGAVLYWLLLFGLFITILYPILTRTMSREHGTSLSIIAGLVVVASFYPGSMVYTYWAVLALSINMIDSGKTKQSGVIYGSVIYSLVGDLNGCWNNSRIIKFIQTVSPDVERWDIAIQRSRLIRGLKNSFVFNYIRDSWRALDGPHPDS